MNEAEMLTRSKGDGRDKPRKPNAAQTAELLKIAEHVLQERGWKHFLETGQKHETLGGGTWNGLGSAESCWFTQKWVSLYVPTDEELKSARLWHDHCTKHGYPFSGVDTTKGYPPDPVHTAAGVWVGLTWKQVRELATADQMQMELA